MAKRNDDTQVPISGLWLRRQGDLVIVAAEIDGCWRDVITEWHDDCFGRISDVGTMRDARKTVL